MLFGSSDAANAITVDKTPAALWVMDVSVRLFGLSSWSVLVPQALEGVAAVALLYAAVRRVGGPGGGAAGRRGVRADAGGCVDVPVQQPRRAAGAAARRGRLLRAAGLRARQRAGGGWSARVPRSGVGFLAKMLQAFLVLPAFGLAYLIAAAVPLRTRLLRLARRRGGAGRLRRLVPAARRAVAGLVAARTSAARSTTASSNWRLGYNGLGRLTGDETGGLGNLNFDVGWGRLFGSGMGAYIAWLLPAAVICLGRGPARLTRRAPRTDPQRGRR